MRNLSPTSFKGEYSYVCHIKVAEMLFSESTLKYGGAIWQKSFPCFDSQERLISSSTSFPTAFSIKPRFWIKGVGPHFREWHGNTYMNDQPYDKVDCNGQQTRQMKNHFLRAPFFRGIVIPFHFTLLLMKIRKNERKKIAKKNSRETG